MPPPPCRATSLSHDPAHTFIFRPLTCAYLRLLPAGGYASAAASEFQKVLLRRGLAGRGVIAPLATLQLARAQSAMGETAAAIGSYQAFLDLWRDADADIPLYVAAKAEHEKLRNRRP